MAESLLTVDEVAEPLQLNPQAVRNWIDRKKLPAVRIGRRRVRIRRFDFDGFLAAGAIATDEILPSARVPDPDASKLREELADSLTQTHARVEDGDDVALAVVLRSLSRAASRLARALERSHWT